VALIVVAAIASAQALNSCGSQAARATRTVPGTGTAAPPAAQTAEVAAQAAPVTQAAQPDPGQLEPVAMIPPGRSVIRVPV
jgi:hypothetical protein